VFLMLLHSRLEFHQWTKYNDGREGRFFFRREVIVSLLIVLDHDTIPDTGSGQAFLCKSGVDSLSPNFSLQVERLESEGQIISMEPEYQRHYRTLFSVSLLPVCHSDFLLCRENSLKLSWSAWFWSVFTPRSLSNNWLKAASTFNRAVPHESPVHAIGCISLHVVFLKVYMWKEMPA